MHIKHKTSKLKLKLKIKRLNSNWFSKYWQESQINERVTGCDTLVCMCINNGVSKWISLYLLVHTLFMHVGKCKLQKCPERGALGQWQYGKIKWRRAWEDKASWITIWQYDTSPHWQHTSLYTYLSHISINVKGCV